MDQEAFNSLAESVLELDAKVVAIDTIVGALLEHTYPEKGERIRLLAAVANGLADVRLALLQGDQTAAKGLTGTADPDSPQVSFFQVALKKQLEARQRALLAMIENYRS